MKKAIPYFSRFISIVLSLAIVFACFSVIPLTVSAEDATHTPIAPTLDEMVISESSWVENNKVQKTAVTGGVNVSFNDSETLYPGGCRIYYDRVLNLDGLYLDFANYTSTSVEDMPRKGFSVFFNNGDNNLSIHLGFDFWTVTNAVYYKSGLGAEDIGTALCTNEALSYSNIQNKPFYFYFDIDDDKNLNVTVNVDGTSISCGYIPADVVAASGIDTSATTR